jgi:hypothetical protein
VRRHDGYDFVRMEMVIQHMMMRKREMAVGV